jgi:hypothetical protein
MHHFNENTGNNLPVVCIRSLKLLSDYSLQLIYYWVFLKNTENCEVVSRYAQVLQGWVQIKCLLEGY